LAKDFTMDWLAPRPTRREWLRNATFGFGFLALRGLLADSVLSSSALAEEPATPANEPPANEPRGPLAPKTPHFAPRAKRVIFLCMRGAPSHMDTFDHKPRLNQDDGQNARSNARKIVGSPFRFEPRGESGLPISELFPNVARHADRMCLLNGMHTDVPNHPEAFVQLHTGSFQFVRPSVGSWALYGLGTENENLPGFITLSPPVINGGPQNYGSSFLPAVYQGTAIGQLRTPITQAQVSNLSNPRISRSMQRQQLDLIQSMNQHLLEQQPDHAELEGVIESYELAFRMQSEVPRLMDLAGETQATLDAYGVNQTPTDNFGRQCLLARRFAEAGVRYIEICHENWDQHQGLRARLTANCRETDQPIGALLTDLRERGLLDDTLVVWGGEFGRTPDSARTDGRDHNARGYSMWLAGGGIRGGLRYGATDEHGYEAVDGKVHLHDLHATILHVLGLDHQRLTYRYAGRDFRLTDVYGRVVREILA